MSDLVLKLNRGLLKDAISSKSERVLYKTGAYALTTIRRSIRAPKKAKPIQVNIGKAELMVPRVGKVLNKKTGRPTTKKLADLARKVAKTKVQSETEGQPPRRGPSDLLRTAEKFTVDKKTWTVTAGPILFKSQPQLVGASDVPELLEGGGQERVRGELVKYGKHPFVGPAFEKTKGKMEQLIEKEQLRP